MNILRKITIQNLKLNKKRSIVTTIGILLSVALITAVATMVTSFRESLIEYEKKSNGNYEYVFYDVPESEISFLKNNRSIKDLYLVSGLGYAKIESQNEAKPYAYVVSMNKNAMENLGLNLVEGKVPTNESEIVIPTSVKTNGRLDYKIGDYITLDIGQRQSEGYNLNQNNPYDIDTKEEIINAKTKTYKIVGIVKRMSLEPYTAPGYTFITYSENGSKLNDVYVYLTNKGLKNRYNVVGGIIGVSGKTLKDLEIGEYNYNLEVMLNEEDDKVRKEKIKQIESLENINRISFIRTIIINADYLKFTKKAIEYGFSNDNINTISIKCVGKKEYDNYLQKLNIKGTLDYDAIIINNFIYSENGSKIEFNVLDYKDGETIELKNSETNSIVKLRAIKSTSEKPLGLENNGEAPVIIVSDETFDKIYNNNLSHLNLTSIYMDAKNANDTQDEIDKLFPNDDSVYVNNTNEYANQMNSLYIIVAIFLYGFIIVIAIIGITNIFNTITTNVALRRGEFASLRSIGMTTKEFNKMIFLESFFYCIKALIIGIPIGIILSLIIHRAFIGEMTLIYHLPLKGIIISIVIVFILIFSLMKYSVKKVNSKNILDSIRDENI